MKLIGSYTSPFVRKISVILLEKAIPFEFVNEFPYHETNGVAQYNPLGKVPALVTDDGDKMPLAKENVQKALYDILGEDAAQVDTVLECGGSGLGAAIAAAMPRAQAR